MAPSTAAATDMHCSARTGRWDNHNHTEARRRAPCSKAGPPARAIIYQLACQLTVDDDVSLSAGFKVDPRDA